MNEKNIKIFTNGSSRKNDGSSQGILSVRKYLIQRAMDDPNFTYTIPITREQQFYQIEPSDGINPPVDSRVFYHDTGFSIETDADVIVIGKCDNTDCFALLEASIRTNKTIIVDSADNIDEHDEIVEYIRRNHARLKELRDGDVEFLAQVCFEDILAGKRETELSEIAIDEIISRLEIIHTPEERVYQEKYQGIDVFYSADTDSIDRLAVEKLRESGRRNVETVPDKTSVLYLTGLGTRIYTMENGCITMKEESHPSFMREFFDLPKEQQYCIVGRGFRSGHIEEIINFVQEFENRKK